MIQQSEYFTIVNRMRQAFRAAKKGATGTPSQREYEQWRAAMMVVIEAMK